MERPYSISTTRDNAGLLGALLPDGAAALLPDGPSPRLLVDQADSGPSQQAEHWRRRALGPSALVRPNRVPPPPVEWAPILRQLGALARIPGPAPAWWTPKTGVTGNVETRTESDSYALDGLNGHGMDPAAGFYFQLGLAGCGNLRVQAKETQRITPGKAFFGMVPSRRRCDLFQESQGWTFAWVGIHNPYLAGRLEKQLAATGPVIDMEPNSELTASFLRLVRGAIKKDFRDQFEAEIAQFEFVATFERWAQQTQNQEASENQRLMEQVRFQIEATLPKSIGVRSLAASFGMSRSHFSHFFRARTGLTPAHFATEVRVQKAMSLLLDTNSTLKVIAYACGFASANHFCKVFRRVRHLTPAAFRQVNR